MFLDLPRCLVSLEELTGQRYNNFWNCCKLPLNQLMFTLEANKSPHLFAIRDHDARIENRVFLIIEFVEDVNAAKYIKALHTMTAYQAKFLDDSGIVFVILVFEHKFANLGSEVKKEGSVFPCARKNLLAGGKSQQIAFFRRSCDVYDTGWKPFVKREKDSHVVRAISHIKQPGFQDTIDRLCDAVPPPFLFRWNRLAENDVADIHINRKCVGFTEVAEDLLIVDLGEQFQGRLRVKHLPCCIHHVFARR